MIAKKVKMRIFGLLVLLGGASYGCVSPVVKLAYGQGFSAGEVTAAQYYYAAAILWLLTIATRGFDFYHIRRSDWVRLIVLGICGTGTAVFYYSALTTLPAWLAIVLLFQFSWITFLIDFLVARRLPTKGQWMGIASIFVGTLLAVNVSGAHLRGVSSLGLLLGLLSSVSYALFLYINGDVETSSSPFLRAALITTVSAICVTIIYRPTAIMVSAMPNLWAYGVAIGLLSQAIPTSLFSIGIPKVGGSAAAILGSVELPVAVIMAALVLHEAVTFTAWAGVILIVAGIVLGEWTRLKGGQQSA